MRPELKTALALGIGIAVAVAAMNAYLSWVKSAPAGPDAAMDKSGFRAAPDIVGIAEYINVEPEELEEKIRGSVVLYDIWTYSCINCIRTLPFITAWDEKYADQGLLIIGIHTPEFEFEKYPSNVRAAVKKYGISYPVVMDNDWETWNAFENRYWPRKYIADHEGYIRYDHIGEGAYQETEEAIRRLLAERADALNESMPNGEGLVDIEPFEHTGSRTPELYLGYHLAFGRQQIGNPEGFRPNNVVEYAPPDSLRTHLFYMEGAWRNGPESMRLEYGEGVIRLEYVAKEVNIVASGPGTIGVYLDGEPIAPRHAGSGVVGHTIDVSEPDLYNVVASDEAGRHLLELYVSGPGLEVFTYTFG